MKQASAKVPGKLYLAGEYAVVTPGHLALLITVDRFLSVQLTETTQSTGWVKSTNYSPDPYEWHREADKFEFVDWSHSFFLIQTVIQTVESYIFEQGKAPATYNINVFSELDMNGKKIGLGSSGAITIALTEALMDYYEVSADNLLVYKLASISHMRMNSHGSFGDLAACAYTGLVAYSAFEKSWLSEMLTQLTISEIVQMDWPKLHIESIQFPDNLAIQIGWTAQPASTEKLVESIYEEADSLNFEAFLEKSHRCVCQLIDALKTRDTNHSLQLIAKNRKLLVQMGQTREKVIETPQLTKLCEIAKQHGGSGKSSGAGGGDCGIALFPKTADLPALQNAWQKQGIHPLAIELYKKGETHV